MPWMMHNLSVVNRTEPTHDDFLLQVAKGLRVAEGRLAVTDLLGWPVVKWDTHEDDLRTLSRQFPSLVFRLTGGSEWNKYFQDGRMQVCWAEITFPPFDESKLE